MMSSTLMPLPLGDPSRATPSVHSWVKERKTEEVPREISRQSSQLQLQADLAELAKGTIAMDRPRWMRSAPKVAWPLHPTSFDPFANEENALSSSESATVAKMPIVAPVPVVPAGPALRAHFMTKAYFAPLSPAKAAFVKSFRPLPSNEINNRTSTESHAPANTATDDDDVIVYMMEEVTPPNSPGNLEAVDENRPPTVAFVDENNPTAQVPMLPAPQSRGTRHPFGVLYYDAEDDPSRDRSPSVEEEVRYPVLHETATRVSVTAPRGWARLRPLAPPPINIEDVNRKMKLRQQNYIESPKQAKSGVPQAPCVDGISLSNVASSGAGDLEKDSIKHAGTSNPYVLPPDSKFHQPWDARRGKTKVA